MERKAQIGFPIRFEKASDPEEGRIGVTDMKSEGFHYVIKPPKGFLCQLIDTKNMLAFGIIED